MDCLLWSRPPTKAHNYRREKRPAYNLISNNCQNFAVELLKAIQVESGHEFGTTFAIYQRATGKGTIRDLFADNPPGETATDKQNEDGVPRPQRQDTATFAQKIMDEKTTKLDHDGA